MKHDRQPADGHQSDRDGVSRFKLRLGEEEFETEIPTAPVHMVDLVPQLHSLGSAIVDAASREGERGGKTISCCAGCGACCRQMVPISEPEAIYLARLVDGMSDEKRSEVRRRFDDALSRLDQGGLLERIREAPRSADKEERRRLGVEYFSRQVPCPFLVCESCSIHPHRPLSCREYVVSSPASFCARPETGKIERVPLPVRPSAVLYRFGDEEIRAPDRWLPLVLALEWASDRGPTSRPSVRGPKLFQRFLSALGAEDRTGPESAGETTPESDGTDLS